MLRDAFVLIVNCACDVAVVLPPKSLHATKYVWGRGVVVSTIILA